MAKAKAKAVKAETAETLTEAQLAAAAKVLAARRKAARAETAERRKTPGLHEVTPSEGDIAHGVTCRCEYVTGDTVEGAAIILHGTHYVKDGKAAYQIESKPWVRGDNGSAAFLVAVAKARAKYTAEIIGWLKANA